MTVETSPEGITSALNGMLTRDNKRMRQAGTALAEAALYTVREYDGLHRLSLAVARWAEALADEGDRARARTTKETDDV